MGDSRHLVLTDAERIPMQSSLWKLGALVGVIGVGFLVLMKAQTGMTVDKGTEPDSEYAETEFTETAAIDELDNLVDSGRVHTGGDCGG